MLVGMSSRMGRRSAELRAVRPRRRRGFGHGVLERDGHGAGRTHNGQTACAAHGGVVQHILLRARRPIRRDTSHAVRGAAHHAFYAARHQPVAAAAQGHQPLERHSGRACPPQRRQRRRHHLQRCGRQELGKLAAPKDGLGQAVRNVGPSHLP